MIMDIFYKKFAQHKSNANCRGIDFLLSFEEWKSLWIESGKWEERGRGSDKYCMCRLGDSGAYIVGNVYIDTNSNNLSVGNKGRQFSQEHRDKISKSSSNKEHPWSKGLNNPMHDPVNKAKISEATSGVKHYRQKGVHTPFGYFITTKIASEVLGINISTIEWRAKHNKFGFFYKEEE